MNFEPIKITLATPVKHGNEEIAELVFARKLCAGDLRGDIKVGQPTYDEGRIVASRIVGIPEPVLKNLEWEDFSQVVAVVMGFFNDSPLIGGRE